MEISESNVVKKYLNRIKQGLLGPEKQEPSIDISMTPEVIQYLRTLVMRDNPNLAEFAFLCLGVGNKIDEILVVNENIPRGPGLKISGMGVSAVEKDELSELFRKLELTERKNDLLVLGHLHPTGHKVINGTRFIIDPSESLLTPSMGGSKPIEGGDLAFFKSLSEINPDLKLPFVGIAANTPSGPKMRIYKPQDLLSIKRYNDIDKVPQKTIDLYI